MIQIPADWALNLWRGQVALNNDSLRPSWGGRLCGADEFRDRHIQSPGQPQKCAKGHIPGTSFHVANVGSVKITSVGEVLLGQFQASADFPDVLPQDLKFGVLRHMLEITPAWRCPYMSSLEQGTIFQLSANFSKCRRRASAAAADGSAVCRHLSDLGQVRFQLGQIETGGGFAAFQEIRA